MQPTPTAYNVGAGNDDVNTVQGDIRKNGDNSLRHCISTRPATSQLRDIHCFRFRHFHRERHLRTPVTSPHATIGILFLANGTTDVTNEGDIDAGRTVSSPCDGSWTNRAILPPGDGIGIGGGGDVVHIGDH